MYDEFHKLSIGRTNDGGGKHPVVSMTTEPAPCELDVYLNARELRDVIFTPLLCRPLPVSHHPPPAPSFVEGALGDNVILSSSPRYILLSSSHSPARTTPSAPRGMAAQTSSSTNNVSSLAVRRINWIPGELIAAEATAGTEIRSGKIAEAPPLSGGQSAAGRGYFFFFFCNARDGEKPPRPIVRELIEF